MEWVYSLLTSEAVWTLLGVLLTGLLGFLWRLLARLGVETEAVDTLRNAVSLVGDDFVVWRKRANEDGKLTAGERTEARDLAIAKAKELATGPVARVLTKWGVQKLSALITRVVQGDK
tara:strand:- start:119 stop:472 length:354 start_codon:yes stop_codon:yes gene_type:complete